MAQRAWVERLPMLAMRTRADGRPVNCGKPKSACGCDECRCNEQARELGGEALRRVEAEQGRRDDARRDAGGVIPST